MSKGPENEGCGCHYSAFGCCPDSLTAAQGANYTGCDCDTFAHGCCPDGVTVAQGSNLEGCSCGSSVSCCPDGVTPNVIAYQFMDQFMHLFFRCPRRIVAVNPAFLAVVQTE